MEIPGRRGAGLSEIPSVVGVMDIFWNYTI